jgi:GNAT superfamily N-acetyltransferase
LADLVERQRRSEAAVQRRDPADLEAAAAVLAEVHAADGYPVTWPERPAEWLAQPSQLAAWVARLNRRVVGHIALTSGEGGKDGAPGEWSRLTGTPVADTAVISRLFVSPSARGHGVGALLLSAAVREARERGLHPVLDVVSTDTAAVALYERLGWQRLATLDQQWGPDLRVTVHCYAATTRRS